MNTPKLKHLNARIPHWLDRDIARFCRASGLRKEYVVTQAISDYLGRVKSEKGKPVLTEVVR